MTARAIDPNCKHRRRERRLTRSIDSQAIDNEVNSFVAGFVSYSNSKVGANGEQTLSRTYLRSTLCLKLRLRGFWSWLVDFQTGPKLRRIKCLKHRPLKAHRDR